MGRRADIRSERGSMVIFVALLLPLMLVFLALAVDAGNWWVHKRHLQIQADAAALAGGGAFQVDDCIDDPAAANAGIEESARKFSGDRAGDHNQQIGDATPASVSMKLLELSPCTSKAVDVEVEESNSPLIIDLLDELGVDLTADARVEIMQVEEQEGVLPLVMRDDRVSAVQLGTEPPVAPDDGVATITYTFDGSQAALDLPVRLTRAGQTDTYADVVHLQGFLPPAASMPANSPPELRRVTIDKGAGCETTDDGYFAVAGCTVDVYADVRFGSGVTPSTTGTSEAGVSLNGDAMVYQGGTTWRASMTLAEAQNDLVLRWSQFDQKVTSTQTSNCDRSPASRRCGGVFRSGEQFGTATQARGVSLPSVPPTPVHATFGHSPDASGLILSVAVGDDALGITSGANTYTRCASSCQKTLTVVINVPPPAELGDPVVLTPDADPFGSSSNRGFLSCVENGGINEFREALALGCGPHTFNIHDDGDDCPSWADIESQGPVWTCVATKPTNGESALGVGMSRRIAADDPAIRDTNFSPSPAQCAANPNTYPNWSPTDRRIVPIFLATNPTGDPGRQVFPIEDFAWVYVTGWAGNDSDGGPCQGIGNTVAADPGTVRGYFIKYVGPNDGSAYGTTRCVDTDLGGCVPVMTR